MTVIDAVTTTAAPPPGRPPAPSPARSVYQNRVADYWNAEENPVNLELGRIDDLYHHHYGIGDAGWSGPAHPGPGAGGACGGVCAAGADERGGVDCRDALKLAPLYAYPRFTLARLYRDHRAQYDLAEETL